MTEPRRFRMNHRIFRTTVEFDENTAPAWLTCKNTVKGSTTDDRWFWQEYVLTLEIGKSVDLDFQKIIRIA